MLQWNDWHPYNAVHVVRLPGTVEVERLKRAITTTLEGKQLSGLALDRRAGTYQYQGGPASAEIAVRVVAPGFPAGVAEEIERQLNTPFVQREGFSPFRFFIVSETDAFCLGLAYFHAMADAECIVFLLKDILDTYRGRGRPGLGTRLDRHPPCRDNLLWLYPGVLARKLASLPSFIRAMRRTCRPHNRDTQDLTNRCVVFSLSPQRLGGMAQAAKSLEVTLNDLWLALLMKAVSPLSPQRAQAARRRSLALGCIVNIRKDLGLDGRRAFGLFLGSFVVHHEVPPGIALAELAREIGRQTRRIKRSRLYLGTAVELAFGRRMASLFSGQRRRKLYQKHYPLWGGLSNLNLNSLRPEEEEPMPMDYFRAVSTGPVTPLVLSVTSLGKVANIGLTYRPSVFSAVEIERIQGSLLDPLTPLGNCS